jgi:hypothetical protein
MKDRSERALAEIGFIDGVGPSMPEEKPPDLKSCALPVEIVESTAQEAKITDYIPEDYEDFNKVVNISVDDICVDAQKPTRPPNTDKKDARKRWDTTVAQFHSNVGEYAVTGDGVGSTLQLIMGFLAFNGLLFSRPIVFFTDGARTIHSEIEKMFSFTSFKIVLDWYHLWKKFGEFFSMACRAKKIRNARLREVMGLLWHGKVDEAISMMRNLPDDDLKDRAKLEQLIDYLNRVRKYIPNYALRDSLGLCNSSSRVEKANDLIVARRQKNKGMSWSHDGSIFLASVSCLCHNGDLETWVTDRTLPFTPIPQLAKAA